MASILRTLTWPLRVAEFALFYLKEVLVANVAVAMRVWSPRFTMKPAIVALSIEGLSDRQAFILASFITMTPGTLSLDVDETSRTLYIHTMDVDDMETYISILEQAYKRRVRDVF